MSHMESSCRKIYAHDQWKETKQANFQEKLLRNISCTRWPLWRKSTHLDGCLHPFINGRDLIHWICSCEPFGWSVIAFPCWMRRHMFVFPACILGDIFDASICCEKPRNPCLLDYSYNSCGYTWDFHPCHLRFIHFIFTSYVHWEHKNLPRILQRLVWIWNHLGDM